MSMRLLFLVEHFRWQGTGLEHSAVRLCRGLAARGHEVHVAADTGESGDGITVHTGLNRISETQAAVRPDLTIDWGFIHPADIHRMGAGTHAGYLDYYLDAFSGSARWWRRLERWAPRHQRVIRRQRQLLARPSARFMANSQLTANLAIEGGAAADRVTVCHQHVSLEEFNPAKAEASRAVLRAEWGLADEDVAFLFVAHNLRLKNLELLRQVFGKLNLPNAKLVVVGKRRPRWTAPWLIFAGEARDMAAVYGAGDALLHPTYFDSCANVVLEAMACARPVLVSDTAGINELLSNGQVLAVRGGKSVVELAWLEAVRERVTDAALRARQGESGLRLAEGRDYQYFLDWFEAYLESVAADRQS
jgi:glycosyltransferase involved in cell wall biosynthesis